MCGIAGIVEPSGSREPAPVRRARLLRMIELIGHRGPDEAGTLIDGHVALAAARLRIEDLEHGQQPMSDPELRFWIVYNGEIYNHRALRAELEQAGHRFSTRCDTEVALRAWMEWGEDAPARFDGGFAFVLYDRRERVAFLVRDRFGKRPLFYRRVHEALVFGSEIKAQLAIPEAPLEWDIGPLRALFSRWTPVGEETPFKGVYQVPAGTILRVSERGLSRRAWGDPLSPIAPEREGGRFEDASDRLAGLLSESVRARLESDVEVGVLLSGGLDSSVIALLARARQPVRTFSIRFTDPRYDESRDQQHVVDALELSHASIEVTAEDIAGAFVEALWHAEIPQFRTAFAPMFLLARTIREHGLKVVLSGEGADETLLGYDIFKEARLRSLWSSLAPEGRRRWIRGMYEYLPHFSDANLRILEAMYAGASAHTDDPCASHENRFANGAFAARLLRTGAPGTDGLRSAIAALPSFAAQSLVRRAQWIEFHTLLNGYLLSSQGDRMTFAHGVESRCPFLSAELVRFAAGLPERWLLSESGDEKHLLKHAFRAALPPEITAKRKRPYRAPDAASFRTTGNPARLHPWAEELLDDTNLRQIEPLDADRARLFLEKLRRTPVDAVSPREDQAFILLLSLAVLDRQFIHGAARPTCRARPPLVREVDLTAEGRLP